MPLITQSAHRAALRKEIRARREATPPAPGDGEQVRDLFLSRKPMVRGAEVAGYWPMRGEMDPRPLMAALKDLGARLSLPVAHRPHAPMHFRRFTGAASLVPGRYGEMCPGEDAECVIPSLLLVPLVAFDRQGWRLGYGGGYYDRTIAALRSAGEVRAVGLARAFQEVPALPALATDIPLDMIVTEKEIARE